MPKTKIKFVCTECGFESLKWLGKCPSCENWNTFTEEVVESGRKRESSREPAELYKLDEEIDFSEKRINCGISEFDRVLCGGIVPGSVVLLGGDPGIGKSTLIMQAGAKIGGKVIYVTGEESIKQINLRARRLKISSPGFYVLAETNADTILRKVKEEKPAVVVIDSIQTIYHPNLENAPGTITQIREATALLMQYAKQSGTAFIIIGHVTKEG